MQYTVTTRAIKNSGDFLIHKRAVEFICRAKGLKHEDLLVVRGDKPLPLKEVNSTKALIICGGPALEPEFYPNIYPLAHNLKDIKVPVFLFGVGAGFGCPSLDKLGLRGASFQALKHLIGSGGAISVRDPITARLLDRYDIPSTVTGCPVLFNAGWDGKLRLAGEKVVFTPSSMSWARENKKKLVKQHNMVRKLLCQNFKEVAAGYHRSSAKGFKPVKCKKLDVTGSAEAMERLYAPYDMHVGYRVHAHIWFISRGRPSFLVPIDTRGLGMSRLLELPFNKLWNFLAPRYIMDFVKAESNGWKRFLDLPEKIEKLRGKAEEFIARIP